MSRSKPYDRGAASYRRGKARCPRAGRSFLIVTEGEKTEPSYFTTLVDLLQLSSADVRIVHPDGTDPMTLTLNAVELRDAQRKKAKKGLEIGYDEVWVVFDLERIHDETRRRLAAQAMSIKKAEGILFAFSDPSFEYWLLIHYEYTTALFEDCYAVIKRLEEHWPDYSKGASPPVEMVRQLPVALKNSQRCRKHHKDTDGDGNPSTQVDLLAERLNSATRPHLQLR